LQYNFIIPGVSQIAVAINKMDTVSWDQARYKEIVKKLGQFLKQAGFKEADVSFVPCSGLNGENLTQCNDTTLKAWYNGPTLLQQISKAQHKYHGTQAKLSTKNPI
jgi:elongation factor 1 alpha-like protein